MSMRQRSSSVSSSSSGRGGARTVAGYVLTEKLGSGSFASVYKARRYANAGDSDSRRQHRPSTVAVKAISKSRLRGGRLQANLESEISILEKLHHPNIVRLYGIHKSERHIYLFLEYCDMGDLHAYIRNQPQKRLEGNDVRGFLAQLAEGVRFLWSQNFIHRDLKPQNLLLSKRQGSALPALKIADFGFARHLGNTAMAETLCGSPLYMAPEILRFHKYDAKADLWSVGTIIYEMLAGKPPFHGSNPAELLRNIESKEVRVPDGVVADDACVDLLQRLLRRNPLERISFHEFFSAPYIQDAPREQAEGQTGIEDAGTLANSISSFPSQPSSQSPVALTHRPHPRPRPRPRLPAPAESDERLDSRPLSKARQRRRGDKSQIETQCTDRPTSLRLLAQTKMPIGSLLIPLHQRHLVHSPRMRTPKPTML